MILGFIGFVLLVWGAIQLLRKEKRKKGFIKIGWAFVFFIGAGVLAGPTDTEPTETADEQEEVAEEEAGENEEVTEEAEPEADQEEEPAEEEADPEPVEEEPEAEEPEFTLSQQNAIRSAENYINTMPFSEQGLIEQLEFEGYSKEEATFAVQNITVDWSEQAVKSAENYLNTMPFSRSGLIEQLMFEGYSEADAVNAVDQMGL